MSTYNLTRAGDVKLMTKNAKIQTLYYMLDYYYTHDFKVTTLQAHWLCMKACQPKALGRAIMFK